MGLKLNFRCRQAFASREVILEAVPRAGDDTILDCASIDLHTEMSAGVLETGYDRALPRQDDVLFADDPRDDAALRYLVQPTYQNAP